MAEKFPSQPVVSQFSPSNIESRWQGYGLTPKETEKYIVEAAARIEDIWAQELSAKDLPESLYERYLKVAGKVGKFSRNVTDLCRLWINSGDPDRKSKAGLVMSHHLLHAVLGGVERAREDYPKSLTDPDDLVALGLLKSEELVRDKSVRGALPARLNSWVYRQAELIGAPDEGPSVRELSYDPWLKQEEQERAELARTAVDNLTPREKKVMEMVYAHGRELREIGEALGVSYEMARKIKEAAWRKLFCPQKGGLPTEYTEDSPVLASENKVLNQVEAWIEAARQPVFTLEEAKAARSLLIQAERSIEDLARGSCKLAALERCAQDPGLELCRKALVLKEAHQVAVSIEEHHIWLASKTGLKREPEKRVITSEVLGITSDKAPLVRPLEDTLQIINDHKIAISSLSEPENDLLMVLMAKGIDLSELSDHQVREFILDVIKESPFKKQLRWSLVNLNPSYTQLVRNLNSPK